MSFLIMPSHPVVDDLFAGWMKDPCNFTRMLVLADALEEFCYDNEDFLKLRNAFRWAALKERKPLEVTAWDRVYANWYVSTTSRSEGFLASSYALPESVYYALDGYLVISPPYPKSTSTTYRMSEGTSNYHKAYPSRVDAMTALIIALTKTLKEV